LFFFVHRASQSFCRPLGVSASKAYVVKIRFNKNVDFEKKSTITEKLPLSQLKLLRGRFSEAPIRKIKNGPHSFSNKNEEESPPIRIIHDESLQQIGSFAAVVEDEKTNFRYSRSNPA